MKRIFKLITISILILVVFSSQIVAGEISNNKSSFIKERSIENSIFNKLDILSTLGLETETNEFPYKPEITISINDQEYNENNKDYHDGDKISVKFLWNESEEGWGNLPDEFTIDLGDFITTIPGEPIVDETGKEVGNWQLNEDGTITIKFTDENFKNSTTKNREFFIGLNGYLSLNPDNKKGNQDNDFKIGDDYFSFKTVYDETSLSLNKTMSDVEKDENGKFISKVRIEASVTGYANEIRFCDTLGDLLSLKDNNSIKVFDKDNNYLQFEYTSCAHGKSNSFDIVLNNSIKNNNIIIEYDVILEEEAVGTALKDSSDPKIENLITGSFKDANDVLKPMPEAKDAIKVNNNFSLEKSGQINENKITWTITFNTGIFGELDEATLDQLGMGDLSFLDSLSQNQTWNTDYKDLESGQYKFTLSDFNEPKQEEDGSWTYTFTYETEISEGSEYPYYNKVEYGELSKRSTINDPNNQGFNITKEFQSINNKNGTLKWTLSVDVPNDTFDKLVITDSPKSDNFNKSGYIHQIVEGSVKLSIKNSDAQYNSPTDYEENYENNNVIITIYGDSSLGANSKGKTILIELETIALTSSNSSEGFLKGNYTWKNDVEAIISYTGHKANQTRKDSDLTSKTNQLDLRKVVENDPNNNSSFNWKILTVSTDPFLIYNGRSDFSGNYKTFNIDLTDQLPEGLSYVDGSAKAFLYRTTRTQIDYGDNLKSSICLSDTSFFQAKYIPETHQLHLVWNYNSNLERLLNEFTNDDFPGSPGNELYLGFTYQTEIDRSSDFIKNYDGDVIFFENSVRGSINENEVGPSIAIGEYSNNFAITKTTIYSEDGENSIYNDKSEYSRSGNIYNIRYEIDINPEHLKVGISNEDSLTVVDTMGKGLFPIIESIQLIDCDTNELFLDYHLSYNESLNQIVINIPDSKHFKLIYYATPSEEGLTDTGNSVELYGLGNVKNSEVGNVSEIFESKSGASSGESSLEIVKYSNSGQEGMEFLTGAEFELYPVLFENGKFERESTQVINSTVEGSKTKFIFNIQTDNENTIDANHIFCLKETKAPEGFEIKDEPIYFIFSDYNKTTNIDELKEAGVVVYNSAQKIYFENSKSTGNLIVSKKVIGDQGDNQKEFNFTVTLDDRTVSGSFGEMLFINGVANFTLKNGETKTATGLYEGLKYNYSYEVTEAEANSDGYTTTSKNSTGEILRDQSIITEFINEKGAVEEIQIGDLIVKKLVAGENSDRNKEFNFRIQLEDTSITGEFGDLIFIKGIAKFTLKHNEIKKAEGLPIGTRYTIEELEANQDGYTTTRSDNEDIISSEVNEVVFTNTKDKISDENNTPEQKGSLLVTKSVTGTAGDKTKEFNFVIELGDTSINGKYGDLNFKDGKAEFTLKDKESVTATDLPEGLAYTVTEEDYSSDGYTTSVENETGTITADQSIEVLFVNNKEAENSEEVEIPEDKDRKTDLELEKIVTGESNEAKNKTFEITILGPKEVSGKSFFDSNQNAVKFSEGDSPKAIIFIKGSAKVVIKDLPLGKYKVIENESANIAGFKLLVKYNGKEVKEESITLEQDSTNAVRIENNYTKNVVEESKADESGNLILTKLISGDVSKDLVNNKEFSFTLVGPEAVKDKNYLIRFSNGRLNSISFRGNIATVTITGQDTIVIEGLPYGNYTIFENIGSASLDGYSLNISYSETNGIVIINKDKASPQLTVTNTYTSSVTEKPEDSFDETESPSRPNDSENTSFSFNKEQSVLRDLNSDYSQKYNGERTSDYIEVHENDIITYYLTVTNTGNTVLKNLIVSDPIQPGLTLIQNSITEEYNLIINGQTIIWTIDEIQPGESVELIFQCIITEEDNENYPYWKNTAYLDFEDSKGNPIESEEVVVGTTPNYDNDSNDSTLDPEWPSDSSSDSTLSPSTSNTDNSNNHNEPNNSSNTGTVNNQQGTDTVNKNVVTDKTVNTSTTQTSSTSPKTGLNNGFNIFGLVLLIVIASGGLLFINKKRIKIKK